MKSKHIFLLAVFVTFMFSSCENMLEDINDNPNQLTLDAVDPGLFMNGALLSNINVQLGYLSRTAGYYSNQMVGLELLDRERYLYNVSYLSFDWDGYQTVISPIREIRKRTTDNPLYQGITKVVEAHLMGTYASLFGDIPFSEAVSDTENPVFDDQIAVFAGLQTMLQEAINDLGNAAGHVILRDYIFNGDRTKWLESAYTLKARYYMLTKEYDLAYSAAMNGISSRGNSMMFRPLDAPGNTTKNKFFIALSHAPTIGTENSYLIQLLDHDSGISRNHAKTDETARLQYYTIHTNPVNNQGIAHELEPQPLVTYQENLLILAEAGARTQGFDTGLQHLNAYRAELATGAFFNNSVSGLPKVYEAFVAGDFASGGIENPDGITPLRALLREIIEERYVSGFTTFMPFDDDRRLRKTDSDIAVPFPLNVPTATQNVERFLYPADEVLTNSSSPPDPGMFAATRVNQ